MMFIDTGKTPKREPFLLYIKKEQKNLLFCPIVRVIGLVKNLPIISSDFRIICFIMIYSELLSRFFCPVHGQIKNYYYLFSFWVALSFVCRSFGKCYPYYLCHAVCCAITFDECLKRNPLYFYTMAFKRLLQFGRLVPHGHDVAWRNGQEVVGIV